MTTPEINKRQRKRRKRQRRRQRNYSMIGEVLKWLCERYPRCFNLENRQPIKIGIAEEIATGWPSESRHTMRKALQIYTTDPSYLANCAVGKPRIGLDGKQVGTVESNQAFFCAALLTIRLTGQRPWTSHLAETRTGTP